MAEHYFEVDVHGEYFAREGDKKEIRGYEATFKLPNADGPLGVIKGKLLPPFLVKHDPQFDGIYTHHIDEIRCLGRKLDPNEIPIRFQSKEQLREYIVYHQLGVNVDAYGSIGLLRDHVRMAKEEPENFPKVQAAYASKQAEDKALHDLNKDVLGKTKKLVAPSKGGQRIKPEAPKAAPEAPKAAPEAPKAEKAPVKKANPAKKAAKPAAASEAEDLLS